MDSLIYQDLKDKWRSAKKRLVLLDYDGTLVEYQPKPELARPDARLLGILHRLIQLKNTRVFLITGRGHADIGKMLPDSMLPIISDHGASIRVEGEWKTLINTGDEWKQDIRPLFRNAVSACPGSMMEEKDFSFTWHYRNVGEHQGRIQKEYLLRKLGETRYGRKLKITNGNKVVEVMPEGISKANAVGKIIGSDYFDHILCIGDDTTDEDMFYFLKRYRYSVTIKVGAGETFARHRIGSVSNVLDLLERLLP